MYLELSQQLKDALPKGEDPFEWFLRPKGTTHREVKHRLTYEAHSGELHFYVKRHLGCGWGEVLKEWYRLRKPVVSARTEWEGAQILCDAGLRVPKVLGKGERGRYPDKVESFVVLDALEDCETLEYFKEDWMGISGKKFVQLKRSLIAEVGEICAKMHACGINHRDLYINHFLINRDQVSQWEPGDALPLYLIDLHRVQRRDAVPERWLRKDISSLVFSALDTGLTSTDCIRFFRAYLGTFWRTELARNSSRWRAILARAIHLYEGFHNKQPKLPTLLQRAARNG